MLIFVTVFLFYCLAWSDLFDLTVVHEGHLERPCYKDMLKQSKSISQRTIELSSLDPQAYYKLGCALFQGEQYEEAVVVCNLEVYLYYSL